jgi:hypothetical protein
MASFIGGDYDFQLNGWDQLEAFYKKSFTGQTFGMHNGHHPEICVDGATATGIWYLQDIFVTLEHNLTIMGSALYDDEYRLEDGQWRISRTGYKRLWEEHHKRGDDINLRVKPIAD